MPPFFYMEGQMGRPMGISFGNKLCKKKNRWLFTLGTANVRGAEVNIIDDGSAVNVLPPLRSQRPNLTFKEMTAQHLHETVYYPAKPDWKPIQLTLYDVRTTGGHPIFEWIKKCYNPTTTKTNPVLTANPDDADEVVPSTWFAPIGNGVGGFIRPDATLTLFDGCGNIIERWIYQAVWPQNIDFQDLDMGNSDYVTCDLTLRYVRAYIDLLEEF